MEKQYQITESLLLKLVNYLGTKPFIEVAQLIQEIQSTIIKQNTDKEG